MVKDDGEEPLGKGRSAPYLGLTGGGIFFSFPLCLITTFVLVGVGLWPLDILAFLLTVRCVSLLILDTFFCFPWSEHFGGDALFFTSVQNVSGTRLFPFKLFNMFMDWRQKKEREVGQDLGLVRSLVSRNFEYGLRKKL